MKKPTGLGMWIAFGDLAVKRFGGKDTPHMDVCKLIASMGVKWVAPRLGDSRWNDGYFHKANFGLFCAAAHTYGIDVYPWVYARPTMDVTRYVSDAVACMGAPDAPLADGFIVNAEVEYKSKHFDAEKLAKALKAALPDKYVAHAPIAWMKYHPDFPYAEFGQYLDAVHPQLYWTELVRGSYQEMEQKLLPEWEKLVDLGSPLAKSYSPIGCTYGRDEVAKLGARQLPPGTFRTDELDKFLHHYRDTECVSLYTLEAASDETIAHLVNRHKSSVFVSPIQNNTAPPFYEWVGLEECVSFDGAVHTSGERDAHAWRKLGELYEKEFGVKPK